jgi:circadian clock protein KaiC
VQKYASSSFIPGRHTYELTKYGFCVYPRTETVYGKVKYTAPAQRTRMPFGIAQLDAMSQGGVFSGSNTLLYGVSGTGKTTLGVQFLVTGAEREEPGLLFGFYETPERLIEKAAGIGVDLKGQIERGLIEILWQPPQENNIDVLAKQLIEAVQQRKVCRLFIDGFDSFRQAVDVPERLNRFFGALTHELRTLDVTTMFSIDMEHLVGPTITVPPEGIASHADNILLLRYVELHSQLYRLISILKMRESNHENTIREFKITQQGIEVAATFASAQAILTGVAIRTSSFSTPEQKDENL